MIERILDKYYLNKLKRFLYQQKKWFIDYRYIENKDNVRLQIKRQEYNESQFITIFNFNRYDILTILCNQQELSKEFNERVNNYLKENRK